VIAQIPTAQQIIPLVVESPAADAGPSISYEYDRRRMKSSRSPPGNLAVQIFARFWKQRRRFYGAQMSAMDKRHP